MDDRVNDLVTRGVSSILPNKDSLITLLRKGDRLNVYMGIDPTATRIHIGHSVLLRKLQAFAELGHNVIFLIGDFTALIGDTSDKDTERPRLTKEQIQDNFKNYKDQASKVLDFDKIKVVHNSEWLKNLRFEDIVRLCQHFSVGDFVGRELIKKRLSEGKPVGLHETLYPIMQGYDSYHLDTDIQLGASDQTFNMLAGRTLLKNLANKESFVFISEYLPGTDGRKMSKSWGNAIWLDDSPNDIYGKVMSLDDQSIMIYFNLATNIPLGEIEAYKQELEKGRNPMELKAILAEAIVSELCGEKAAAEAKTQFTKIFRDKEPDYSDVYVASEGSNLLDIVAGISGSKSEAKRLIEQRAVDINGDNATNSSMPVKHGDRLKVGKKKFVTIKINEN